MGNKYNYGNNIYNVLHDPLHKYSFSRGEVIAIICCVNFLCLAIAVIVVAAYYHSIKMRLFMGVVIYLPSSIYNYFAIRKLRTMPWSMAHTPSLSRLTVVCISIFIGSMRNPPCFHRII